MNNELPLKIYTVNEKKLLPINKKSQELHKGIRQVSGAHSV